MAIESADPANADQIAYWGGAGGRSWVARQELQEASLEPVSAALFERTQVRPGERVIDVGCGTGATTAELARRVGAAGRVLGIDVSEPMLARAGERLAALAQVSLVQADATSYRFPPASFDLAVSRFGVMFFAAPVLSFANLRTALAPGGRLAFACWRRPDENPWLTLPLRAALAHAPAPPQPGPDDPGMFSFASEARVRRILAEAGFAQIALEPRDFEFDPGRGKGLDEAVSSAVAVGPASRVLADQPPATVRAATDAIRAALRPLEHNGRIPLAAAVWIVTASNP